VLGGAVGRTSRQRLIRADGRVEKLPSKATNLTIAAGDLVCMETAGGGGYGPPTAREPDAVLADVLDGKVSVAAARATYGAVIDPVLGAIDLAETDSLRAAIEQSRETEG
jgi:N-methylhydantoinase B